MSIYLPTYPFTYLFTYRFTYLFTYQLTYLPTYLSKNLSTHPSFQLYLSIYLSVYMFKLFIYPYLFDLIIYMSVYLSVYLTIHRSIHTIIYLFACERERHARTKRSSGNPHQTSQEGVVLPWQRASESSEHTPDTSTLLSSQSRLRKQLSFYSHCRLMPGAPSLGIRSG